MKTAPELVASLADARVNLLGERKTMADTLAAANTEILQLTATVATKDATIATKDTALAAANSALVAASATIATRDDTIAHLTAQVTAATASVPDELANAIDATVTLFNNPPVDPS